MAAPIAVPLGDSGCYGYFPRTALCLHDLEEVDDYALLLGDGTDGQACFGNESLELRTMATYWRPNVE